MRCACKGKHAKHGASREPEVHGVKHRRQYLLGHVSYTSASKRGFGFLMCFGLFLQTEHSEIGVKGFLGCVCIICWMPFVVGQSSRNIDAGMACSMLGTLISCLCMCRYQVNVCVLYMKYEYDHDLCICNFRRTNNIFL